jgi:hypothetical protein
LDSRSKHTHDDRDLGSGLISTLVGVTVVLVVLFAIVQTCVVGFELFRLQSLTGEAVREATAGTAPMGTREALGDEVVTTAWPASYGSTNETWSTSGNDLELTVTVVLKGTANTLVNVVGLSTLHAQASGYLE